MVSRLKEKIVRSVFFFTAFFAVIVVVFILLFLLRDGYSIFETVGYSISSSGRPGLRPRLYPNTVYPLSSLARSL